MPVESIGAVQPIIAARQPLFSSTRLFQKVFDVHVDGCRVQTSIFLFCFDDKRVNQVPEEDYSFLQHCLVTTSRHSLNCLAPISDY